MIKGWYVIIKLKYYDFHFEFQTVEEAGEFAKTALMTYRKIDSDDPDGVHITLKPIIEEAESEEGEDE